jgi:hypothetical protein
VLPGGWKEAAVSANPEHDEDVARADDLTQIAGIGPKRAERLNAAGIRTYADLAARPAGDLTALLPELTRLSAAQLDGWRDRARELSAPPVSGPAAGPERTAGPSDAATGNGQHEESFLVRVLLNEDGSVRRTTVRHVGTGDQRQWPGMERDAMPGFIEAAARSAPRPSAPASPAPPSAEPPAAAGRGLAASARMVAGPTVLRAAEPFTMIMAIDLAEAAGGADRLAYTAIVVAKPLAGGPKRTVAQSDGLLSTAAPTIHLDAAGLPPGTYRVDGAVSLRESGEDYRAGLAAMAEGLLVHVLPG